MSTKRSQAPLLPSGPLLVGKNDTNKNIVKDAFFTLAEI